MPGAAYFMQADILYQLLNPLIFLVFASGFFIIHGRRNDRVALLIGLSYIVGAIAFISDIVFSTNDNILLRTLIAGFYALTAVLIVGAINLYYRKDAGWHLFAAILTIHLAIYAHLLTIEADWLRSISANFGCGFIFMVGLVRIRPNITTRLDNILFYVGLANCAQCFIRPLLLLTLAGGTLSASTHSEALLITTLHLVVAVAAVLTAMSLFLVLGRDMFDNLETQSDTDALTNLLNRRGFEKKIQTLFNADTQTIVSVAVVDIDHFKKINDTYGHASGDEVIVEIGKLLTKAGRADAISARLGGEEFVILFPEVSLVESKPRAEVIRKTFAQQTFQLDNQPVYCTLSVGVAERKRGESIQALLSRADEVLYLAKREGRNCCKCELDLAVNKLKLARINLEDKTTGTTEQRQSTGTTDL